MRSSAGGSPGKVVTVQANAGEEAKTRSMTRAWFAIWVVFLEIIMLFNLRCAKTLSKMVGMTGFELAPPYTPVRCATKLRHIPKPVSHAIRRFCFPLIFCFVDRPRLCVEGVVFL